MTRAAGLAVLLLSLACTANAALPSWYECDCSQRDNCACPGTAPPGGLAPEDTPQFILFTHDDAIVTLTDQAFRSVCDGRKNPDGCPARATMFTQVMNTDCQLAKKLWEDGYEFATHTTNHIAMPAGYSYNDTLAEILGAKKFLSEECGIPADSIRGFRSPYLVTNPVVRQVLHENGFLYDSTLIEAVNSESISTAMGNRAWPYTLDAGIAQNCDWFRDTQTCDTGERWPGLWEVPMWVLSVLDLEFTMDVGFYGGRGVYEPLMAAFDAAYSGNRAPLPIFVHTTWVEKAPSRIEELKRFADAVSSKPDVFWVTMSQLIEWVKNPVSASELRQSGALCQSPPTPPPTPALPASGANVTLLLAATPTQVADQKRRLQEAVQQLLGGSVLSAPFVADVSPSIGGSGSATATPGSGTGSTSGTAGAGGEAMLSAQSVGGPQDGWLQFEGPSHADSALGASGGQPGSQPGTVSALSVTGGAPAARTSLLLVTLAAASSDPMALLQHATLPARRAELAAKMAAMGLQPSGEPTVVPIKDCLAMPLPSPPAPPVTQPAPTEAAPVAPAVETIQPPTAGTVAGTPTGPDPAEGTASAEPAAASGAASPSSSGSSSGSSGSSGLPVGAIAGIAAAGAVAAVAAVVAGWMVYKRRQQRRAGGSVAVPAGAVAGSVGVPHKDGQPADSVSIAVTAA